MVYQEDNNIMKAFFKGKISINDLSRPTLKRVEIGHGKGIGYKYGTYSQYIEKLSEQVTKGNGIIYIGKSVTESIKEKGTFSISNHTDKFTIGDVPHLLINYNNVIDDIFLKVIWKDSDDVSILEQYYEIPRAHSMGNSWWDYYGIYFIGPEDLEEGNYKVEIISEEMISKEQTIGEKKDNIKTLRAILEFSMEDPPRKEK